MSFKHPAHYNYQWFLILQSGDICAAATLIDLLASIIGLTTFFPKFVFLVCFMHYNCIFTSVLWLYTSVWLDSSWNVMAHGNAREGNWRMEWVDSTLHITSEHGVSSITTADVHTSAVSSRRNWRPRWFKWTRPFRQKTKSGFCACAVTFQTQSNTRCMCDRASYMKMTRGTNLMQQLWFIIINNSTCFGHLYAHLQECRLCAPAYGVQH